MGHKSTWEYLSHGFEKNTFSKHRIQFMLSTITLDSVIMIKYCEKMSRQKSFNA